MVYIHPYTSGQMQLFGPANSIAWTKHYVGASSNIDELRWKLLISELLVSAPASSM